MNVQKPSDNSSTASAQRQSISQRQPPLAKKDSSTHAQAAALNHYDPSQRGSSKRRPAPLKPSQPSQSRKLSGVDDSSQSKIKQDAVIIKNSELQQIKSSLKGFQRDQPPKQSEGESIFGLMNQHANNESSEFAGLILNKQHTQQPARKSPVISEQAKDQLTAQLSLQNEHLANLGSLAMKQQMVVPGLSSHESTTQASYLQDISSKNPSNMHQIAIVGNPGLMTSNNFLDKESKQKMYQEELQRQIRERDEIRKKELDEKTRKYGSLAQPFENQPVADNQAGFFPKQQQYRASQDSRLQYAQDPSTNPMFLNSDKNLSQKLHDINYENAQMNPQVTSTFYHETNEQARATMYPNAMLTKQDFPQIHTRGKVVDNRLDVELESKGSIFQGRDEKMILIKKKEESQNAIKEALQRQIEEKNKKKEEDKMKERQLQIKEEQRLKAEGGASGNGYEPIQTFGRKTGYNNYNQISIIGSSVGTQDPQSLAGGGNEGSLGAMKSPHHRNATNREMPAPIQEEVHEENIYGAIGETLHSAPTEAVLIREAEQLDNKNKQINDLSEMVKVLLEEQRSLKEKLEQQEFKMKEINEKPPPPESSGLLRKQTGITKKASERVRSQNPTKKIIQSADNKQTLQARKLREQHAIEQAKLEAIENKIEKARRRIEDAKTQKSVKAQQSVTKLEKQHPGVENINELLYGGNLDDDESSSQQQQNPPHVPLIGGSKIKGAQHDRSSGLQLSTAPNKTNYSQNTGASLVQQHKRNPIPPTAQAALHNQRLIGQEAGKPQKAPRGTSNKTSSSNLPFQSIDQDRSSHQLIGFGLQETGQPAAAQQSPFRHNQNNSQLMSPNLNQNSEALYNLDHEGVSQLTYPIQEGQFFTPNVVSSSTKKSPIAQQSYDAYKKPGMMGNQTQQNYNMAYDPARYQPAFSQQNHMRQKNMSEYNYENMGGPAIGAEILQGSREFVPVVSKNPSTAAGSYMPGLGGGYGGAGLTSGGGLGIGQMPTDNFDLDIMMPPDIDSIDSDINKLNAMTPTPLQNNLGWGIMDSNINFMGPGATGVGLISGGFNTDLSATNKLSQYQQFDDSQSIYDSKYSPSRAGGTSLYSRDIHGANRFYDQ